MAIMMKKSMDQRGETGMVASASGYTTNTNPGPDTTEPYLNNVVFTNSLQTVKGSYKQAI